MLEKTQDRLRTTIAETVAVPARQAMIVSGVAVIIAVIAIIVAFSGRAR